MRRSEFLVPHTADAATAEKGDHIHSIKIGVWNDETVHLVTAVRKGPTL